MNISVERARSCDFDEVVEVFDRTIRDTFETEGIGKTHASNIGTEIDHQVAVLQRHLATDGDEELFWVAKFRAQIVGTIASGPANDIIRRHLDVDFSRVPEVKSLYVMPEFQNRGVGSLLFETVLLRLRETRIDEFCLDSGYKRAGQYWIRKLGEPTIILADYWEKGADHLIWHARVKSILARMTGDNAP